MEKTMCFLHGSQVNGLVFFLGRTVHGHFGSPGALGLKSGYWFPFGPCPTVGLMSVISFCILDYKANTCSLQKVQTMVRYIKQKGKWSVASWQIPVPRENQLNWRIFSHTEVIIQPRMFWSLLFSFLNHVQRHLHDSTYRFNSCIVFHNASDWLS